MGTGAVEENWQQASPVPSPVAVIEPDAASPLDLTRSAATIACRAKLAPDRVPREGMLTGGSANCSGHNSADPSNPENLTNAAELADPKTPEWAEFDQKRSVDSRF